MRRPRIALRLIVPATLIVAALWLISGCVFIPTFSVTTKGKNAADQVGGPHSWAKLKTGRATFQDVERILGPPPYATPDGSRIAYTWQTLNGIWLWPLCFAAQ